MTSRRIALWAALAAATCWSAKSIAIGVAGGLDKSPLEAPLFFFGLVCFVVAAVALGVAMTRGRHTLIRVAAGIGGLAGGFAFTTLVDATVGAFHSTDAERHWVWVEFNLWVAAATALTIAVLVARKPAGSDDAKLVLQS